MASNPPNIQHGPDDPTIAESDKIQILAADPAATLHAIQRKEQKFIQTMGALQNAAFSPENIKVLKRNWPIGQAAEMVGVSRQAIRKKEGLKELAAPIKGDNGRHAAYSLQDINRMRAHFGTLPHRAPTDEPCVLSFSTFKGGCGKTQLSVHFAQAMALKGYRVLFIDCDPQGSATTLFGINPDLEASADDTNLEYSMAEFLSREFENFAACIVGSYFPGIDLVPANMTLANAEFRLAADLNNDPSLLNDLRDGIRQVWQDYDIIVLDPPPALGLMSLSVLNAANALVIPMQATVIDFASTSKFMTMLYSVLNSMLNSGFPVHHHFQTILINNLTTNDSQEQIADAMTRMFSGVDLLGSMMRSSAAIDSASKQMMTMYDLQEPAKGGETHRRCMNYLDNVTGDIELLVRKSWPSQKQKLRNEAKI